MPLWSLDALDGLVQRHSPHVDELEVLAIRERTRTIRVDALGQEVIRETETGNLLLTLIRDKHLGRLSISSTDPNSLERRITPAAIESTLAAGERASYRLNRNTPLPVLALTSNEPLGQLNQLAAQHYSVITQFHPKERIQLLLTQELQEYFLVNSLKVRGCYWTTRYRGHLYLDPSGPTRRNIWIQGRETREELYARFERPAREPDQPLPPTRIRDGASPLILTPYVLEALCGALAAMTSISEEADPRVLDALPASFCLRDVPKLDTEDTIVPFDDEGTPTREKILIQGNRRVELLSDLRTASAASMVSSGNGFRRGVYPEPPSDLAPSVHPIWLKLDPGSSALEEILREHPEVVLAASIAFPYGQRRRVPNREEVILLNGLIFRSGKPAARLIAQPWRGFRALSQPPSDSQSLLQPSMILLREGATTASGWFPHAFVPDTRW